MRYINILRDRCMWRWPYVLCGYSNEEIDTIFARVDLYSEKDKSV